MNETLSTKRVWAKQALGVFAALSLFLMSCGDDDAGPNRAVDEDQASEDEASGGAQQSGGEITIRTAFHVSVDPATAVTFGCCGGTELAALYDTILRYDHETQSYVERTAETVTSNDDFTEWTVVIKPGITFTDGTEYDAEAVKFNIERHMEQPRSQDYQLLQTFVESVEVVDHLTVQINLTESWNDVKVILAGPTGMIASPTAVRDAGDDFGVKVGVGAGPFAMKSFVPNERLVLERNPDFYGGDVYLDRITSVVTPSTDDPIDSIKAGTIDASPVGNWEHVAAADKAGYPGLAMDLVGGQIILMNGGTYFCQGGTPAGVCDGVDDGTEVQMDVATADERVRLAVMHAIDRDRWNKAFYKDTGQMSTDIFPEPFQYAPGVVGPEYDADEARRLVDEAKADGWDGRIHLVGANESGAVTGQQTLVAMLEAVGMEPELDLRPPSEYLSDIQVGRTFDVYAGSFGFGQSEEKLFGAMFINLRNRYGYGSPESEKALERIRTAASDQESADAWEALATVLAADAPFGTLGNSPRRWVHVPHLHGVLTNANQTVVLDKAWLEN